MKLSGSAAEWNQSALKSQSVRIVLEPASEHHSQNWRESIRIEEHISYAGIWWEPDLTFDTLSTNRGRNACIPAQSDIEA